MQLEQVTLSKIISENNLRDDGWEKSIDDLMKSIKAVGLKQPPVLSANGDGTYNVEYGYRRVEACKRLGMKNIPALVIKKQNTEQTLQDKVAENYGRHNFAPLEEARIFQKLKENGLPVNKIAAAIGTTEGYVSQRLQLLKLPEEIQTALEKKEIEFAHARELLRIEDPKKQKKLLAAAKKYNVQQFANMLSDEDKRKTKRGRPVKKENPEMRAVKPRNEILAAEAKLDKLRVEAINSGNKLREEFIKGMLRAFEWTLGNIDQLV